MAFISAKTILTSVCLFHITLGFFFLTNPGTVADQAVVYILGEAMGLPYSRSFDAPSPALAFLGVVMIFMGFTDMVTLSLPEEICLVHYWGAQAPLRVLLSMLLLFYSFFFSASSPLYGGSPARMRHQQIASHRSLHSPDQLLHTSPGDGLKNRIFFSFMFIETISWFWTWVTLREERGEVLARKARRRGHSLARS